MSPIYRSWLSVLAFAIILAVALGGEAGVGVASQTNVDLGGGDTCEDAVLAVEDDSCVDNHLKCPMWAKAGECEVNAKYMQQFCRQSCGSCSKHAGNYTVLE